MQSEDLERLREAYEGALSRYESICASLNRQAAVGQRPTTADLADEREARTQLEAARSMYLDAWMLP
jgi:hypothetical protein